MPYKPNGSAVIMHKLRNYRQQKGLTAVQLTHLLETYGAQNVSRYGTKERSPYGWQMADRTDFRQAAGRILDTAQSTLVLGVLPNPCNYCHQSGTGQVCGACGRTEEERDI